LTTNSSFIRLPGSSSSAAEAGRAGSAPSHTPRTLSAGSIRESGTREFPTRRAAPERTNGTTHRRSSRGPGRMRRRSRRADRHGRWTWGVMVAHAQRPPARLICGSGHDTCAHRNETSCHDGYRTP
jgi:hypothetical protein